MVLQAARALLAGAVAARCIAPWEIEEVAADVWASQDTQYLTRRIIDAARLRFGRDSTRPHVLGLQACVLPESPPSISYVDVDDLIDSWTVAPLRRQAFKLLARGFSREDIATMIGVSRPTIDTYVREVRRRLRDFETPSEREARLSDGKMSEPSS